ncbi:DUF2924 domain-containing protein [Methylocystis rosea]|uniref:DUF2924 domain-containing protein n=1 Tax=Methylocystis rosea TaxID=173366 RepID=UPI0003739142|nr:DUF2924 domain-containing protein [Methylocystis rosea]
MARSAKNAQPAIAPADDIEAEIARVGAMNVTELRMRWREVFGCDPSPTFSKDLLARAIAYHIQERAYGGLARQTSRLLRSTAASPGAEPPRQVKVGSVIVREHKGVLHEVMVVPGGFCWRGETYDSLSTIAKKITGVSWSGPRFFGLRTKAGTGDAASTPEKAGEEKGDARARPATPSSRSGRRSSVRTGGAP